MKRVVFDIETVGVDLNSLGDQQREYVERRELQERLGLYPLFAEVVTVAMVNPDSNRGRVFFQAPGEQVEPFEEDGVRYQVCDERGLLEHFWDNISSYGQFITYNGRGFDAPFLLARSAKHRVRPSVDLMGYRYISGSKPGHLDLMDQLSYFGANRDFYSLDMWCRFLGVKSPKEEGVSGGDVKDLFAAGKYLDIARYCARDVHATAELFRIWEEYFRPG